MRQMISKAAMVAVLVGLISSGASAADKKADRGAMMAARAVEPFRTALTKVTDLTDDEKTKTDAILDDATAQVQALIDDAKADAKDNKATAGAAKGAGRGAGANPERRQKLQELNAKTAEKIEAVLTDSQKPEFKKALAAARVEARGNRGAGGGAGLGGRRGGATTKPTA